MKKLLSLLAVAVLVAGSFSGTTTAAAGSTGVFCEGERDNQLAWSPSGKCSITASAHPEIPKNKCSGTCCPE